MPWRRGWRKEARRRRVRSWMTWATLSRRGSSTFPTRSIIAILCSLADHQNLSLPLLGVIDSEHRTTDSPPKRMISMLVPTRWVELVRLLPRFAGKMSNKTNHWILYIDSVCNNSPRVFQGRSLGRQPICHWISEILLLLLNRALSIQEHQQRLDHISKL